MAGEDLSREAAEPVSHRQRVSSNCTEVARRRVHDTPIGALLREDQLVAVCETQTIKTSCVLNHDFALLGEQIL